jgi:mRNA-degrading endonuclease RelE of RelBE toxin-antitoxin system
MKFRILLHKRADRFLRELKPEEKKRLVDKFRQLEIFPAVRLDILSRSPVKRILSDCA